MSLITGEGVTKSYGEGDVLKNISLTLEAGDRIGLVGRNGEGKTTLLRILAGLDEPTTGEISARRDIRTAYLPQEPPDLGAGALWESALTVFDDLRAVQEQMDVLAGQLADEPGDKALLERFGRLQHDFESRGGYAYEQRIKAVLTGLGFGAADYARPLTQFSGGQRTRVALAKMLLEEPDVLLLDEPTNHLDLVSVEWLERYLAGFTNTLIVVSHDRYFLDKTTAITWEIAFTALQRYRGNYTAYLGQRAHRFAEQMKVWETQQEYIRRTEEFIRRHHAASRSKEAHGRKVRLERFLATEAIERPRLHRPVHIKLVPRRRSGEQIFKTTDLAVGYEADQPLLTLPDMRIERGDRVAIIGPNGAGKTTLLRTLLGELAPLAGEVQHGSNIVYGYLPQMRDQLDADKTVLAAVREVGGKDMDIERGRRLLGGFLFSGDDVFKRLGDLSGGERSRVMLARLSAMEANVLVLDEPTNHLDIPATEALQEVLADFGGTIVFVSHDRYLIDHLATQIWTIEGPTVSAFRGRWEQYMAFRAGRAVEQATQAEEAKRPARKADRDDPDRKRKRDINARRRRQEKLEDEIQALEYHLEKLSKGMTDASVADDLDAVHGLAADYKASDEKLKALWEDWTHVSESLEE